LGLRSENLDGEPLLKQVMAGGRPTGPVPTWLDAQERFNEQKATLPQACLRLRDPRPLGITPSQELIEVQQQARQTALRRIGHPA
jgi:hypothetical protein